MLLAAPALSLENAGESLTAAKTLLASPLAAAVGTGFLVFLLAVMMIVVATWRPARPRRRTSTANDLTVVTRPRPVTVPSPPVETLRAPTEPLRESGVEIPRPPLMPQVERFDPAGATRDATPRPMRSWRLPAPMPGPRMSSSPAPQAPLPLAMTQSLPPRQVAPTVASQARSSSRPAPLSKPPLPVRPVTMPPSSRAPLSPRAPLSQRAAFFQRTPVSDRVPASRPLPPSSAPPPSIEPRVMVLPPTIMIEGPASIPPTPVHLTSVANLDFEDDAPTEFSEPCFDPDERFDGTPDSRAAHATAPRIRKVEPDGPRYESRIMKAVTVANDDDEGPTSRFPVMKAAR